VRKKRALELTYEFCKQIASNFNTRNELKHGDPSVYNKCRQKGWIFDFFPEVVHNKPYEKADFLTYVEKNGPEKLYKNNVAKHKTVIPIKNHFTLYLSIKK
jgi:hypothetical protein